MSVDIEKISKKPVSVPYFLDSLFPNVSESHYDDVINYFYQLKHEVHNHKDVGNENKNIIHKGFLGSTANNIVSSLNLIVNNFDAFHGSINDIIKELEASRDDIKTVKNTLNDYQESVYDTSLDYLEKNGNMGGQDLAQKWNTIKNHMIDARENFDEKMLEHNKKLIEFSTGHEYHREANHRDYEKDIENDPGSKDFTSNPHDKLTNPNHIDEVSGPDLTGA